MYIYTMGPLVHVHIHVYDGPSGACTYIRWALWCGHLWDHVFCYLGILISENMHGIQISSFCQHYRANLGARLVLVVIGVCVCVCVYVQGCVP